jgi:hypothetical protein
MSAPPLASKQNTTGLADHTFDFNGAAHGIADSNALRARKILYAYRTDSHVPAAQLGGAPYSREQTAGQGRGAPDAVDLDEHAGYRALRDLVARVGEKRVDAAQLKSDPMINVVEIAASGFVKQERVRRIGAMWGEPQASVRGGDKRVAQDVHLRFAMAVLMDEKPNAR